MTNKDKYLKDGVDMYELIRDMTEFYMSGYSYNDNLTYFFNHKVKPNLTEDEKVILRNLGKNTLGAKATVLKRIGDNLYVEYRSIVHSSNKDLPYNHLFQFIQPRRRI